jgi:ribosomal RNA methyltransferase Nop2
LLLLTCSASSDDPLKGTVEELDLGSEEESEGEEQSVLSAAKRKRSKQSDRPLKIVPTVSDRASDSDDVDEDEPVTMANMEARSRALDARATREAELDLEEMQRQAADDDDDVQMADVQAGMDEDGQPFDLPTAEEREQEEKAGSTDVLIVQKRMRECIRVLGNFKKLAAKGRCALYCRPVGYTYSCNVPPGHVRNTRSNWYRTSRVTTDITNSSPRSSSLCSPSLK